MGMKYFSSGRRVMSGSIGGISGGSSTLYPTDPNPFKFTITKHASHNNYTVVMVNYPNCTNYEGNKILVFRNMSIAAIRSMKSIDPHFLESMPSLIARFAPTKQGWNAAISFIRNT